MRQVLVDHARRRKRARRGGDLKRVPLDSIAAFASDEQPGMLLALDEALTRLAGLDPLQAEIVDLLYFTGMTQEEVAKALNVSARTVNRKWRLARAWLQREIRKGGVPAGAGDSWYRFWGSRVLNTMDGMFGNSGSVFLRPCGACPVVGPTYPGLGALGYFPAPLRGAKITRCVFRRRD